LYTLIMVGLGCEREGRNVEKIHNKSPLSCFVVLDNSMIREMWYTVRRYVGSVCANRLNEWVRRINEISPRDKV
jgi:hypothetical protein